MIHTDKIDRYTTSKKAHTMFAFTGILIQNIFKKNEVKTFDIAVCSEFV